MFSLRPHSFLSDVKIFVNNHKPLCVLTLGLSVIVYSVGNLGGRAISWILQCCKTSEKVKELGPQTLKKCDLSTTTLLTEFPNDKEVDLIKEGTESQLSSQTAKVKSIWKKNIQESTLPGPVIKENSISSIESIISENSWQNIDHPQLDEDGMRCYLLYESSKKIVSSKEENLLKKILSYQATKELYKKAISTSSLNIPESRGTPWTFDFVDIIDTFTNRIEAQCREDVRKIVLLSNLSFDRALGHAIFELTNAISQPAYEKLKANIDMYSCEEFVKGIEYIEWEGLVEHHRIIQLCIKEHGWSETLDITKDLASMSFDDYWNYIKTTPHIRGYQEIYQKYQVEIAEYRRLLAQQNESL